MLQDVTIQLVARETADGQIFLDQYRYDGTYHEKNGKPFILYREPAGEQMKTSVIRLDGDKVAVLRDESLGGHMVFDPHHRQKVRYQTEFGQMEMYLTTEDLSQQITEHSIRIYVDYYLQILFSEEEAPDPEKQDLRRSLEICITDSIQA